MHSIWFIAVADGIDTHGVGATDLLTYVECSDLCIAVVNETTRVVVCAVGGRRCVVEAEERAAAA